MTIPIISDYPMPQGPSFPTNKTQWQVDPKRAVLLIHDMQRYFLRFYDGEGELMPTLVRNLALMLQWARQRQIPIVYSAQPHEQGLADRALLNDMWGPGLTKASPEQQLIHEALAPAPGDIILSKWRYSAFHRSDLLERMRSWKRDQLVIGGVYAHIGCMVTATDAFMNDIQAFMIGDAVADFSEEEHRFALKFLASRCGHVLDTASLTGVNSAIQTQRQWLQTRVQDLIEDDAVLDPNENLIFYGLDSLRLMQLAADLKRQGLVISFEELARTPTLTHWWSLLESRNSEAG